jgi:16S rRNA (adenine1518-N6/adenine1519-N6)-dimethyltransferase
VNHDSPAEIRVELERCGLTLKKRWGQNFLINRGARESMVEWLSPRSADHVWEIGPGLGAMTELLLKKSRACVVFEIDRGMCRYLEETYKATAEFALVPGDFVKNWRGALQTYGSPDLLLGNLPYRSASMIIASVIEGGLRPRRAVMTVQREAADRMCSRPGFKSYSSFSILCQAAFAPKILAELKPGSFYPAPEVSSAVVELVPLQEALTGASLEILEALTRGLFASRRKTIRNNIAGATFPVGISREDVEEALRHEKVDLGARAEELAHGVFVRVATTLAHTRAADAPPPGGSQDLRGL